MASCSCCLLLQKKAVVVPPPPRPPRPPRPPAAELFSEEEPQEREPQSFRAKEKKLLTQKRSARGVSLRRMQAVQGHMEKEGHFFTTWRRRMFFLKARSGLLEYYDDSTTPWTRKGAITLEGASASATSAGLRILCGTGKVYNLRCDAESKRRWLAAIDAVVAGSRDPNEAFDAFHSAAAAALDDDDDQGSAWTRERSDFLFDRIDTKKLGTLTIFELQRRVELLKAEVDPTITAKAIRDAYTARTLDKADFFYLMLQIISSASERRRRRETTTVVDAKNNKSHKSTAEDDKEDLSAAASGGAPPPPAGDRRVAQQHQAGPQHKPPARKTTSWGNLVNVDSESKSLIVRRIPGGDIADKMTSAYHIARVDSGDIDDWRRNLTANNNENNKGATTTTTSFSERDPASYMHHRPRPINQSSSSSNGSALSFSEQ